MALHYALLSSAWPDKKPRRSNQLISIASKNLLNLFQVLEDHTFRIYFISCPCSYLNDLLQSESDKSLQVLSETTNASPGQIASYKRAAALLVRHHSPSASCSGRISRVHHEAVLDPCGSHCGLLCTPSDQGTAASQIRWQDRWWQYHPHQGRTLPGFPADQWMAHVRRINHQFPIHHDRCPLHRVRSLGVKILKTT